MNTRREPRFVALLVRLFVRGEGSEFVLGDLEEDFNRIADTRGVVEARRWYRAQAVRTVAGWLTRAPRTPSEAYWRDLRHVTRGLGKAPTYTFGTVLTLALGIGGAVTVAALGDSVLRPLPFPDSDRLVAVWETREGTQRHVSPANYLDWRATATSFTGLAAHDTRTVSVTVGGLAARAPVAWVSGNYFDVLGLDPLLGRTFAPGLDTGFPERVAVLSHAAWTSSFAGDPDVVGRSFRVDDVTYEVIGVMPAGLEHPDPGLFAWLRSRSEAPDIPGVDMDLTTLRDAWYFQVVGRLTDDATVASAGAEMAGIATRLEEAYPVENLRAGTSVVPLLDQAVEGFGSMLLTLALIVGLVLAAAAANVTHLSLARSAAQARDVAVKLALGASTRDVRRGMLIEGWLLGVGGAAAGTALAAAVLGSPLVRLGGWIPRSGEVRLAPTVIAFALGLGLAVGTWVAMAAYLRSRGATDAGTMRGGWSTNRKGSRAMIAGQVAVALALLAGTGLLAQSLQRLAGVDLGFREDGLATLRIAMPDARALPYDERVLEYARLVDEIERLPAVASAGIGSTSPLDQGSGAGVVVVGEALEGDPPNSGWQPVDAGFFEALGIPVVRGRLFGESDRLGAEEVAVVNEAFVRTVLGERDPIGVQVTMGLDGHDKPLTIVGVVADTRTRGPTTPAGPVLYRPLPQTVRYGATAMFVAAHVDGDENAALASIRDALRAIAPSLPVYAEARGADLARPFRTTQTALLTIVAVFGATALLLGAVGIYAVAAYGVRRRRREIGVRLALGADASRVTREVLGHGLRDALIGVPIGLLLALLLGRALDAVLFGVGGSDVVTLAGASVAVIAVSTAALFVPSRMAAATSPSGAMRDG